MYSHMRMCLLWEETIDELWQSKVWPVDDNVFDDKPEGEDEVYSTSQVEQHCKHIHSIPYHILKSTWEQCPHCAKECKFCAVEGIQVAVGVCVWVGNVCASKPVIDVCVHT